MAQLSNRTPRAAGSFHASITFVCAEAKGDVRQALHALPERGKERRESLGSAAMALFMIMWGFSKRRAGKIGVQFQFHLRFVFSFVSLDTIKSNWCKRRFFSSKKKQTQNDETCQHQQQSRQKLPRPCRLLLFAREGSRTPPRRFRSASDPAQTSVRPVQGRHLVVPRSRRSAFGGEDVHGVHDSHQRRGQSPVGTNLPRERNS